VSDSELEMLKKKVSLEDDNLERIARRLGGWGPEVTKDRIKAILWAAVSD